MNPTAEDVNFGDNKGKGRIWDTGHEWDTGHA